MGFTSVLIVNNDLVHERKDSFYDIWSLADGKRMGFPRYLNGISMPWNEHSDGYCLMLVGGIQGKVLVTTFDSRSGPTDMDKIEKELLKELAKKHGMSLRRKHTKKTK